MDDCQNIPCTKGSCGICGKYTHDMISHLTECHPIYAIYLRDMPVEMKFSYDDDFDIPIKRVIRNVVYNDWRYTHVELANGTQLYLEDDMIDIKINSNTIIEYENIFHDSHNGNIYGNIAGCPWEILYYK